MSMFTFKDIKSGIKKYVESNKRRKTEGYIETEIVIKNVKYIGWILYIIGAWAKEKPEIKLLIKYIHGNNVRVDNIQAVSSSNAKSSGPRTIYSKTKFAEPITLTESIRVNCKLETPLKVDPIVVPELIRALYRFSYKFDGFVIDVSLVKSKKILNSESFRATYTSILKSIKNTIGGDMMAKVRDSQNPNILDDMFDEITKVLTPEVEIEFTGGKVNYDDIMDYLIEIDKAIETPIDIFDNYIKYIANEFDIQQSLLYNKPIDLNRNDLQMLKEEDADKNGFAISYKKDGIRAQIFINQFGNILIALKPNSDYVSRVNDDYSSSRNAITLIDAEYIPEISTLFAFDIAINHGVIMDTIKFPKRIEMLQKIVDTELSRSISIKTTEFFSPLKSATLSSIASKLLKEKNDPDKAPFKIDGLIYTPVIGTYKDTIFRWKPENTIDFVVDFEKKFKKKFKYKLYSHAGSTRSHNLPPGISDIRTFPEYPDEKFTIFQHANRSVNRLSSVKKLINHGIYELAWRNKMWVVLRYRPDKKRPNYIIPARMIYSENILNPISEKEITNLQKVKLRKKSMAGIYFDASTNPARHKQLMQMSNFHNAVKRLVYNLFVLSYSKLLDIGTGRANDLPRWIKKNFEKIVGIEINRDNIAQAEERINSSELKKKVMIYNYGFFEWFNSQKKEWERYEKTKFDVVTVFFSSHYFLSGEKEYALFFDWLSKILRPKAKVIIIDIDGSIIFNKLIKRDVNDNGKYRFGLIPEPTLDSSAYIFELDPKKNNLPKNPKSSDFKPGIKVDVFVSKIGTVNSEYLLDIDTLITIGKDSGYKLIDRRTFEQYKSQLQRMPTIQSPELRTISYSNTVIVFEYY